MECHQRDLRYGHYQRRGCPDDLADVPRRGTRHGSLAHPAQRWTPDSGATLRARPSTRSHRETQGNVHFRCTDYLSDARRAPRLGENRYLVVAEPHLWWLSGTVAHLRSLRGSRPELHDGVRYDRNLPGCDHSAGTLLTGKNGISRVASNAYSCASGRL